MHKCVTLFVWKDTEENLLSQDRKYQCTSMWVFSGLNLTPGRNRFLPAET